MSLLKHYCLLLTLCCLSTCLHGSFSVSPLTLELQSDPESTQTSALVIRNSGDSTLSVDIKAFDFVMEESGKERELAPGESKRGCAQWLSLSPSGLVDIPPGEQQDLRVTVNVPPKTAGTYWAKIAVLQSSKPKPIRKTEGQTTMQVFIKQRWEVRVHHTIRGTSKAEGDIVHMQALEAAESNTEITTHFENTGNTLLRCKGRIEIKDEEGNLIQSLPLGDEGHFAIYPGAKRVLTQKAPTDLKPGYYVALAVVDFGGDSLVAGELEFEQTEQSEKVQ